MAVPRVVKSTMMAKERKKTSGVELQGKWSIDTSCIWVRKPNTHTHINTERKCLIHEPINCNTMLEINTNNTIGLLIKLHCGLGCAENQIFSGSFFMKSKQVPWLIHNVIMIEVR